MPSVLARARHVPPWHDPIRNSILASDFSQSPRGDELDERRLHFPAVQADAHDIEIRIGRQAADFVLPVADPVGEPADLV